MYSLSLLVRRSCYNRQNRTPSSGTYTGSVLRMADTKDYPKIKRRVWEVQSQCYQNGQPICLCFFICVIPPHLLDEKNKAFDCSVKKKAAEAASSNRCLLVFSIFCLLFLFWFNKHWLCNYWHLSVCRSNGGNQY